MRDALIQEATPAQVAAFAAKRGLEPQAAKAQLAALRERTIQAQRDNPYRFGYEPEIWLVAKMLLRSVKPNAMEAAQVRRQYGLDWEEAAAKVRRALGFAHPVGEMLIMGANRAGKTDFAAKLAMETCMEGGKSVAVGFQSLPTGKKVQEPRLWHYMPNEYKARNVALKKNKDVNEHISYTKQNGFAGSKITFGNGSDVRFISYEMDSGATIEGMSLNLVWLDEEFPMEFLKATRFRTADTRGVMLCTFTPVKGYTPVVADYLKDIEVTRWHTAWMLPKDGLAAMPWKELGLDENEYTQLGTWRNEGAQSDIGIPEARPEKILERILAQRASDDFDEIPGTRSFERVPRIGVARGGEAAVVWFYGRDNPYGNPMEVVKKAEADKNATKELKTRVYGLAERIKGRIFSEFSREKHLIDPADIPAALVRVQIVDPAPERNWAFMYVGLDPNTGISYVYREWPGNYEIPGVGHPGPWAVLSDRKGGINDGDKGEATESFNFGYLSYKFEWARLEGWADYEKWAALHGLEEQCRDWDELEEWSEANGVKEAMELRVIDARAASQSKIGMTSNQSLFEDVSKLAEGFQYASGQRIDEGLAILHDLFAKDKLRISRECMNTIFALETFTGADGQKGAVKDFIDLLRYYALSGILDYAAEARGRTSAENRLPEAAIAARTRPLPNLAGRRNRPRVWW